MCSSGGCGTDNLSRVQAPSYDSYNSVGSNFRYRIWRILADIGISCRVKGEIVSKNIPRYDFSWPSWSPITTIDGDATEIS